MSKSLKCIRLAAGRRLRCASHHAHDMAWQSDRCSISTASAAAKAAAAYSAPSTRATSQSRVTVGALRARPSSSLLQPAGRSPNGVRTTHTGVPRREAQADTCARSFVQGAAGPISCLELVTHPPAVSSGFRRLKVAIDLLAQRERAARRPRCLPGRSCRPSVRGSSSW